MHREPAHHAPIAPTPALYSTPLKHEALELFTTCPPSNLVPKDSYDARVRDVARWSDDAGCAGILVYTDNGLVDPWLLSQLIIQHTRALAPLVAVQPIYMHPYTVAKMIASIAHLHGRRIWLNLVAGGFKNDLIALNDTTPHDQRYERIQEYVQVIQGVLATKTAFSFSGKHYKVERLKMTPPLPDALFPGILLSGSSAAGLATAAALGATAVQYPKPSHEHAATMERKDVRYGVRVGVLARDTADEAWRIAEARFPVDRKGQLTHELAMKVTDSHWHKQLSELGKEAAQGRSPYWLVPFENYKTFCPYLVGDHATVGKELAGYLALGVRTFILDVPETADDLPHTRRAFERAQELLPS
jgi:alkanesulfonate monooxygenase